MQFMPDSFHAKPDLGQELHQFFRTQVFLLSKMWNALAFGKMWVPEENECQSLIPPARPQPTP